MTNKDTLLLHLPFTSKEAISMLGASQHMSDDNGQSSGNFLYYTCVTPVIIRKTFIMN